MGLDRERVKNVVKQMSLEEKTALTCVSNQLETCGLPRLKVPAMKLPYELFPFSEDALFSDMPSFSALGHTFDRDLVTSFGKLRSRQAQKLGESFGGAVSLGVARRPFSHGMSQCFSEEPIVCAQMAQAFAEGAALPVIGYNLLSAGGYDRRIGERALNEIYLAPLFRTASRLGGVCLPYGLLNGVPIGENRGFMKKLTNCVDGIIITPPASVTDKAEEVSSGHCLDIAPTTAENARLYNSVKNGLLYERKLDLCVERNVYGAANCYNNLKTVENVSMSQNEVDSLYLRLALESAVLLKNKGVLPLASSDRVACFGSLVLQGALNVYVDFHSDFSKKTDKLASRAAGANKAVIFVENCDRADGERLKRFVLAVKKHAQVIVVSHAERYFELPFLNECDAFVYLPYFGKGSVKAVQQLLCGQKDFSGKLACSWAKTASDYPCDSEEKFARRDFYAGESVYIGNRYFAVFKSDLLFPFGYGLCYDDVDFGAFKACVKEDKLRFSFDVKGRSDAAAETVVLISGGFTSDAVYGTADRLAAFERISLAGSVVKRTEIITDASVLDVYDAYAKSFVACGAKYDFHIGSLYDVRSSASCKCGKKIKSVFGSEKELPSYHNIGGRLSLLGRDIEKETGAPLNIGQRSFTQSEITAADKAMKKTFMSKAVKKDARASDRFHAALALMSCAAKRKLAKKK